MNTFYRQWLKGTAHHLHIQRSRACERPPSSVTESLWTGPAIHYSDAGGPPYNSLPPPPRWIPTCPDSEGWHVYCRINPSLYDTDGQQPTYFPTRKSRSTPAARSRFSCANFCLHEFIYLQWGRMLDGWLPDRAGYDGCAQRRARFSRLDWVTVLKKSEVVDDAQCRVCTSLMKTYAMYPYVAEKTKMRYFCTIAGRSKWTH